MDELEDRDVANLLELAKNTIELKVKAPAFNKEIVLENNKVNKRAKALIQFFYKPTNVLIDEIYIKGENIISDEIMGAALSFLKKINENIFIKEDLLNDLDIQIHIISKLEPLGKNSIERLKNLDLSKHGVFIKYGMKEGFLFPYYKNLDKTKFLEEACTRIGLPPYYWKQTKVNIYRFEARRYKKNESGKITSF